MDAQKGRRIVITSKKFDKGSDEFNFFAEFYKMVQEFYIP